MATDPSLAMVHSWDLSTGVDGPGTRFVLFLSGCPLRCLYCQNPDTWQMRYGTRMGLAEVLGEIENYRRFLKVSGGGVTVSGGEPMLQSQFVTALFGQVRDWGLNTALDTSGFLGRRADKALLDVTDLILLDLKSYDPATYKKVTGESVVPTLDFAQRLAALGKRMWIRFVLVPGLTDDPANVEGIAGFAATLGPAVERVEVLPFHKLGAPKWEELRKPFPLADTPTPTKSEIAAVTEIFQSHQLPILVA